MTLKLSTKIAIL